MDRKDLKKLIDDIASGAMKPGDAISKLAAVPFLDIGIAKHDGHRALRNGFSEVILCEGKRDEHVIKIVRASIEKGMNVFGTRASGSLRRTVQGKFPKLDVCDTSRTFSHIVNTTDCIDGKLAIVAAGTADLTVAEEAAKTARFFGAEPVRHYDVGIAGIHRLFSCMDELREMDVVIVAAGMEGALPSVVGGLLPAPVIAVPTSVGYGANFKGVAALLGMLNSCSEGITVVNIDNGFGAACAALRILRGRATEE